MGSTDGGRSRHRHYGAEYRAYEGRKAYRRSESCKPDALEGVEQLHTKNARTRLWRN